jgi:hypothetical protein
MNTKTIRTGMIAALAAVGLVGCGEPWPGENKTSPQIARVIAMDPASLGGFDPTGSVQVNAPDAAGVWQLSGMNYVIPGDPTATPPEPDTPAQASLIVVQANKLLDGASIQVSPTDCTPVPGALTITPAPPAGNTWYTCYNPTSPNTDQGGSVMIYAGSDANDPGTATALPVGTLVTVSGSVKDHQGQPMPVNVRAQF